VATLCDNYGVNRKNCFDLTTSSDTFNNTLGQGHSNSNRLVPGILDYVQPFLKFHKGLICSFCVSILTDEDADRGENITSLAEINIL